MVHETQLDTAAYLAVCPGRRLLAIAKSFDEAALKNAVRRTAIPILRPKMTGQQPYFIFRESACSSPSAPNNKERRHTNRHYPQSYHDLLFVRWKGGGMSVEEESP